MKDKLVLEFETEMMNIYIKAKELAKYNASIFHDMVYKKGGLETAKYLINSSKVSSGYTALWERGYLNLTVEAVIFENTKWHPLFSLEEIEICSKRLKEYGYIKET